VPSLRHEERASPPRQSIVITADDSPRKPTRPRGWSQSRWRSAAPRCRSLTQRSSRRVCPGRKPGVHTAGAKWCPRSDHPLRRLPSPRRSAPREPKGEHLSAGAYADSTRRWRSADGSALLEGMESTCPPSKEMRRATFQQLQAALFKPGASAQMLLSILAACSIRSASPTPHVRGPHRTQLGSGGDHSCLHFSLRGLRHLAVILASRNPVPSRRRIFAPNVQAFASTIALSGFVPEPQSRLTATSIGLVSRSCCGLCLSRDRFKTGL